MKERRLGRVRISGDFIHNSPSVVAKVFSKIQALPLQIEQRYDEDTYEYLMYSPLFRHSPLGKICLEYRINITAKVYKNGRKVIYKVDVEPIPFSGGTTGEKLILEGFDG